LELSSSTPEIREICEKRGVARAELGDDAATELAQVLADIEASENYAEFAAMFKSQITDQRETEKCFLMRASCRIVFRSGHPHNLGAGAAPTDWSNTTRIQITAFEKV
jgi:hypothetical protein